MSPESHMNMTPLMAVMQQHVSAQDDLLSVLTQKATAIRTGDMRELGALMAREQSVFSEIRGLEQQRSLILRRLGFMRPNEVTLTSLAARADEPEASQLVELSAALRDRVERVRRIALIVQRAAESLTGHMAGVMQHLAVVMNQAATYGSGGRIESGAAVNHGIDIKS